MICGKHEGPSIGFLVQMMVCSSQVCWLMGSSLSWAPIWKKSWLSLRELTVDESYLPLSVSQDPGWRWCCLRPEDPLSASMLLSWLLPSPWTLYLLLPSHPLVFHWSSLATKFCIFTKQIKLYRGCLKSVVTNLSDLMYHQWSSDHRLPTLPKPHCKCSVAISVWHNEQNFVANNMSTQRNLSYFVLYQKVILALVEMILSFPARKNKNQLYVDLESDWC